MIAQTDKDWKAIIIYDGVEGREFSDRRIKTIHIEKTGSGTKAGLVRNVGITNCDTEWIGFLDDDDSLDIDYVKTLKKYLDYDIVIFRMVYPNGDIRPQLKDEKIRFANVGISFAYKNKGILFDENKKGEDFAFISKIIKDNYIITPEICYKVNY